MDLKDRLSLFISRHQTIAWVLILMAAGLLFQGIMWIIFNALGREGLYDSLVKLLVLPPNLKLLLRQPWSIVTFPFFNLNFDILRLLVDGLILWAFGRIHQQLMGDQRTRRLLILAVPIIGLLTATISTVLENPFIPENQITENITAEEVDSEVPSKVTEEVPADSAATSTSSTPPVDVQSRAQRNVIRLWYPSGMISVIMVLVLSSVTLVPAFQIQMFLFGRVKIAWIGGVLLLLEMAWALFYTPLAIAIAIGALLGFLHVYLMRKEIDITEMIWSYYSESNKPKMTVSYKAKDREEYQEAPVTYAPKNKKRKGDVPQETVDKILDKISEKGYESLSREEKEILYKASSQKEDEQE